MSVVHVGCVNEQAYNAPPAVTEFNIALPPKSPSTTLHDSPDTTDDLSFSPVLCGQFRSADTVPTRVAWHPFRRVVRRKALSDTSSRGCLRASAVASKQYGAPKRPAPLDQWTLGRQHSLLDQYLFSAACGSPMRPVSLDTPAVGRAMKSFEAAQWITAIESELLKFTKHDIGTVTAIPVIAQILPLVLKLHAAVESGRSSNSPRICSSLTPTHP